MVVFKDEFYYDTSTIDNGGEWCGNMNGSIISKYDLMKSQQKTIKAISK
jgi:hypothetical protein